MSKITPEIYKHRPMFVRHFIVLLALAMAYGAMSFTDSLLATIASYFVAVTALDAFSYYVLGIKSSDYADAAQLMADDQTTLNGLDKYASDRRIIRIASLVIGLLISGIVYLVASTLVLLTFCISFFVSTIVGLAILKPHYRKKYPVIIKRNDSYYVPARSLRPGFITPAQASLAMDGSGPWGPIQH